MNMTENKKDKSEETPKKPVVSTECVICGCTPKPDEWSSEVKNACIDCM